MRYLHRRATLYQVVVNPTGEHRRFHPRRPRLWQVPHKGVQSRPGGRNGVFLQDRSIGLTYAIADSLFVYVQSHVMHVVHGFLLGLQSEGAFLTGIHIAARIALHTYTLKPENRRHLIVNLTDGTF